MATLGCTIELVLCIYIYIAIVLEYITLIFYLYKSYIHSMALYTTLYHHLPFVYILAKDI